MSAADLTPAEAAEALALLKRLYGTWGSKSTKALDAHKALGDFLVRFNGAPLAYRGRLNPDAEPYQPITNPRN